MLQILNNTKELEGFGLSHRFSKLKHLSIIQMHSSQEFFSSLIPCKMLDTNSPRLQVGYPKKYRLMKKTFFALTNTYPLPKVLVYSIYLDDNSNDLGILLIALSSRRSRREDFLCNELANKSEFVQLIILCQAMSLGLWSRPSSPMLNSSYWSSHTPQFLYYNSLFFLILLLHFAK